MGRAPQFAHELSLHAHSDREQRGGFAQTPGWAFSKVKCLPIGFTNTATVCGGNTQPFVPTLSCQLTLRLDDFISMPAG